MQRFQNMLFVAEEESGTSGSSATLMRAVALAINNQASLTVIGVVGEIPRDLQMALMAVTPAELLDQVVAEKRDQLEAMVKAVHPGDGLQISVKVLVGRAFIEIIREVLRNNHDLVIKSAEKHEGISQSLFGSTDMHLMRKCPCPVWIIKPTGHDKFRRILAAVDQDPESSDNDGLNQQILELSSSLALAEGSEFHIVHAWSPYSEALLRSPHIDSSESKIDALVRDQKIACEKWLEDLVSEYARQDEAGNGPKPQLHLVKGDARHEVPRIAREFEADLIVMGTVGRTGISGFFMGNTAEDILKQVECSGLTVKPPGFVSPVTVS